MIQRIQSVLLLIAAIAMTLLFFFPIASFLNELEGYYIMYLSYIKYMTPGTEGLFSSMFLIPPAIVAAVVIGVSVFTIFKFKNRMLQMKLVSVAMFFNIILILLVLFIYVPKLEEATKVTAEYVSHAGIYLPLVSLIMLILSNQAIRRDERKVRSLDRLR